MNRPVFFALGIVSLILLIGYLGSILLGDHTVAPDEVETRSAPASDVINWQTDIIDASGETPIFVAFYKESDLPLAQERIIWHIGNIFSVEDRATTLYIVQLSEYNEILSYFDEPQEDVGILFF